MLAVSNAFNEAFKSDLREVKMRIKINDVTYTDEDIISFNFNSGSIVGETFAIGSTYANSIKLTLCKIVEGLKQLDVVVPEMGIVLPNGSTEYVKLGTFLISEEVNPDRNENRTSLECTDRMLMLDDFYESKLKYPAEIRAVALEIANLAGVEVDKVSFGRLRQDKIKQPIGYTYREAIGLIAQFEAGYACFDRNGLLAIRQLEDKDYQVTPNEYFQNGLTKNELKFRPAGIQVKVSDTSEDDKVLKIGNEKGSVIRLENKVMTDQLLRLVYEKVKDINYYPYSLKWRGNPAVEVGDWLQVTDTKGNLFKVPNLSYSFEYKGGLTATSTVETVASNEVRFGYKGILNQVVEYVNNSIKNIDGNVIHYGVEKPPNPKEGDTWFKYVDSDTEIWVYEKIGEPDIFDWVLKISSAVDDTIKDKIEELEQTSKDISESVDKALEDADIARKEAFDSIKMASEAKADIVKVQDEVNNVKTEANKKLEEAGKELETINGKVNKQGLTVKHLDDELQVQSAKVEANSTSVASLKLESDRIATEVVKANEKVDNLDSASTNLILNSDIRFIGRYSTSGEIIIEDDVEVIEWKTNDAKRMSGISGSSRIFGVLNTGKKTPKNTTRQGFSYVHSIYVKNNHRENQIIITNNLASTYILKPLEVTRVVLYDFGNGSNYLQFSFNTKSPSMEFDITYYQPMIAEGTVVSAWQPAPEDYADKTEVTKLSTKIDQTAELVKIKADKSEVDTINKTVKENKAQIEVHNQQIQLKASQSEVDKINDTVNLHESEIKLNSEQIKLQNSKINNNSTEISNIKVESNKISSAVSKVENNLDVSGSTNLILDSDTREIDATTGTGEAKNYRYTTYYMSDSPNVEPGTELTFRFFADFIEGDANSITVLEYPAGSKVNVPYLKDKEMSLTFTKKKGTDKILVYAGVSGATNGNKLRVTKAILHKGKLYTDWSPAPEDLATQVEFSSFVQTSKGFQQTTQNDITGLRSQQTQLSDQMTTIVESVNINLLPNSRPDTIKGYSGWGKTTIYQNGDKSIDVNLNPDNTPAAGTGFTTLDFQIEKDKEYTVVANVSGAEGVSFDYCFIIFPTGDNQKLNTAVVKNGKLVISTVSLRSSENAKLLIGYQYSDNKPKKYTVSKMAIFQGKTVFEWSPYNFASSTQITQLQNQINLNVKKTETIDGTVNKQQGQINVLSNNINLKVDKNNVVAQINLSPETIRLDAKKIHLSGTSLIDSAVIKEAHIANAAITTAKIQDATISSAKIISIDANKINANALSAITTNTGRLNVSGWMSITRDNAGISGSYDYGDKYDVAYPRWYYGDFRLSHRHLLFSGYLNEINPNGSKGKYLGYGESYYGSNYFKSRWYSTAEMTNLKGRIDIRDDFVRVSSSWGESLLNGSYMFPDKILTQGIEIGNINGREGWNGIYFNDSRHDLADLALTKDSAGSYVRSNSIYKRTYNSQPQVCITDAGTLGRIVSARKYKTEIWTAYDLIDKAKNVLSIQPKSWVDKMKPEGQRHYGFIADEFEENNLREVVLYGSNGDVEGLSYDRITTYHNVILSEHEREIQELKTKIKRLEEGMLNGIVA
ncbi:hypothetical protein [Vagococcus carniphilus]|uniref:hypothetical protein n=1 Tax=Vagococcus carniphilus TaxID=218144 RepID=UPI003BA87F31